MPAKATVIPFKTKTHKAISTPKYHRIKNADSLKYFTKEQIRLLRRSVRDKALIANQRGNSTGVKDWMIIDLMTCSGLRVSEVADLRCDDISIGYGQQALYVRNGKGGKSRTVQIPASLKRHLNTFIAWKRDVGESTEPDSHIFMGQRGPLSPAGVSQVVKKHLKAIGLWTPGRNAHSLRHSYACSLYKAEKDLRAVQKQLGHSSVETTMVYADVMNEDLQRQVKSLW